MKKVLNIIVFIFLISIFNINDIKSVDYSYLLEDINSYSKEVININVNSNELINIFNDNVYLISVTTDNNLIGSILVKGNTLEEQIEYINNKSFNILNEKGLGETGLYYKLNGINLTKIKIYGRNKDLYNLINNI